MLSPSPPSGTVTICGVNLAPIEYRGVRVMTLGMMDAVHQRADGTARRTLNENRKHLVKGEDFHEVDQPDEIRTLGFSRPQGGTPAMVVLLTETGYSMLVKSFTDDLAWDVQRQLVKSYFKPSKADIPDFSNRAVAARAWADEVEAKELALAAAKQEAERATQLEHQVAEQAPAVAGFDRLANASGTLCITDAAKNLQVRPSALTELLLQKGWMYHRPSKRGYLAYQDKIQAGYLTHKMNEYEDPKSGEQKVNEQVRITQRGLTKLALLLSAPPAPPSPDARRLN